MNAAWGTMQERDTVALNLTESHKTVKNIKTRGGFTVSIADAAHVVEADYCELYCRMAKRYEDIVFSERFVPLKCLSNSSIIVKDLLSL